MKELETVVQDEKNKWILITGILQVLACVIMNKFDISNPNIILFVILSAVLVQFGYGAGMLCGFITSFILCISFQRTTVFSILMLPIVIR